MVYTIFGIILGSLIGASIGTSPNQSFANIEQFFYILIGAAVGGGIGFGFGLSSLVNGSHIIQKMTNWKT